MTDQGRAGKQDTGRDRDGRSWRAADDEPTRSRPSDQASGGFRAFIRRLVALFSLDPRSGGR